MITSRSLLERIWMTLHEPRVITFVVILYYLCCVVFGSAIFYIAIEDTGSWIPDTISFTAGSLLVVAGVVGIPASWKGYWWLERGSTVLLALCGALILVGTIMAAYEHREVIDRAVSWAAMLGGVSLLYVGLNRWFRVGLDPFAPDRGPMLPKRRIEKAQEVMRAQTKEAMLLASQK